MHHVRHHDGNERAATPALGDEDVLRADLYGLLSALRRGPASAEMLGALAALEGDDSDAGRAVGALARLAATTDAATVAREYHDLFIGVGRGELVPYGSYYLTGFLNEKPLGLLRNELARMGVERSDAVREPEDHIAALMEVMEGLIRRRFGAGGLGEQARFHAAHVAPWASHFFSDLEGARASRLYAPVGTIGKTLMAVEGDAFAMAGAA